MTCSAPKTYDMSSQKTEELSPKVIEALTRTRTRKRGRPSMYKTLETRKQKNREAQASYRNRQTSYVKDLEDSNEHVGKEIRDLQQIHAATREECLLLRYKISLLKRILFEKGIDAQAELKRHQQQRSDPGLAVLTSGRTPQQQTRNAFRLGTSVGTRNVADPRSNPAPSLYQAHMDQLEKEYEENSYTGITTDEDLSDHVVGPGPYPERFYEQPVFQGHAPVVGSGAEALMPPLAIGQPGNLRAPLLSTANQTCNPYYLLTDDDPFCLTASTPFPTQFGFTAPTSGEMALLQEVTSFGNSLTLGQYTQVAH